MSYRVKAYSILAALLFVWQVLIRLPTTPTALINSICDNQGLIKVLQQHPKFNPIYPNYAFSADWDLLEEIYTITTSLYLKVFLLHNIQLHFLLPMHSR